LKSEPSLKSESSSEKSAYSVKKRHLKSYEKEMEKENIPVVYKNTWIEMKMKRDLEQLEQYLKPMPRSLTKYRKNEFLN